VSDGDGDDIAANNDGDHCSHAPAADYGTTASNHHCSSTLDG
jgi:hypothetical protein